MFESVRTYNLEEGECLINKRSVNHILVKKETRSGQSERVRSYDQSSIDCYISATAKRMDYKFEGRCLVLTQGERESMVLAPTE